MKKIEFQEVVLEKAGISLHDAKLKTVKFPADDDPLRLLFEYVSESVPSGKGNPAFKLKKKLIEIVFEGVLAFEFDIDASSGEISVDDFKVYEKSNQHGTVFNFWEYDCHQGLIKVCAETAFVELS